MTSPTDTTPSGSTLARLAVAGSAGAGSVIILAACLVPFATISLGGSHLADVRAFGSPPGLNPWFAGLPVGSLAVPLALAAAVLAAAVMGLRPKGGAAQIPGVLLAIVGIGAVAAFSVELTLLGVRAANTNAGSRFGLHLAVHPGIGYSAMLAGATAIAASAIPALMASTPRANPQPPTSSEGER